MYCRTCGKNIPDDSRFCEYCGSPVLGKNIEEERVAAWPEETERRMADSERDEGAYGQDFPPWTEGGDGSSGSGPKKKSNSLKIIALFAALILFSLGGYGLLQNFTGIGKQNKPVSAGSSSAEEAGSEVGDRKMESKDGAKVHGDGGSSDDLEEADFQWRKQVDYYRIPEGGQALSYREILGEWKLMAVNYLPDTEEQHFSYATIGEYIPDQAHMGANTSLALKHQYTQYDGEKYYFDEEDATDLVLASFGEGILQIALAEDKVMDVLFWEKDGKQYGHSYLFRDDDQDGFADLVFSMSFIR